MTHAMRRSLFALPLMLLPLMVAAGETQAPPTEVEPQAIEQMIATLEDPQARAELIGELRVLLEAERARADGEAEGLPLTGGELVDTLRDLVADVWGAITSVDPRQLLVSLGVTLLIAIVAVMLRWMIVRLLQHAYARLTGSAALPPDNLVDLARVEPEAAGLAARGRVKLPAALTRLIDLIIAVLAVALIAESWGAGIGELLGTDIGARIAEAGLALGLILLLTSVAWHMSGLVVARLLAVAGHRGDERRARRVDTLAPLLRTVLQVIIAVLAALLILAELGVNITPLLAGAGVLGLAIGFGAQSLVKDVITGVTILLEDGATLGDVVDVAGHVGVVEDMRLRIMQLRDLAGIVHLIPYGEVTSIMNYTKDFSFYLMDVGVAYREDTDEVCAALHEVAEELSRDPEFGGDILVPLEILGVDKVADSAMVIKARIKTKAGRQWATGREFNRRMKKLFDARGIEIPFPHTTVYFGEPKQGVAPPARLTIADAIKQDAANQDAANQE
ncbi:MAG: mechanosensitive ion channel family protein [Pseudomonadales bacterium]